METITINPVILIGGSGTRLWPMSRVNYPKQFNKFLGDHSLFQQTLLRLSAIQNCGKIILVVGESNYFLCLDQLRELSIDNVDIIVEPIGKNTAPAVAVAAEYICQNDNDNNLMLVLPSDHQIKDTDHFIQTVHDAMHKAYEKLVLFGVVPNSPATGYGYIQAENNEKPAKVAQFIEKPCMEKTNNAYVFPLQSDWSDLGDWNAVYQIEKADEQGNVAIGNVLSLSTKNSYLHSHNKLLTTIGIDNLVVVSAKDSVLIADKNKVQDVKILVDLLKSGQYAEHAHNDLKVHSPWGSYESVINMDNFQVKHIVVKPGGTLSLQLHHHRSEHWIVVKGIAEVVCGENAYQVHENQSTYIPKETKHRLMNLQSTPLHLIEVQVGGYLGEDDIVRYDDVYGRADVRDSVDVA